MPSLVSGWAAGCQAEAGTGGMSLSFWKGTGLKAVQTGWPPGGELCNWSPFVWKRDARKGSNVWPWVVT